MPRSPEQLELPLNNAPAQNLKYPFAPGQRFGRLVVVAETHRTDCHGWIARFWVCRCDCGQTKIIRIYDLTRGRTRGCGCKEPSAQPNRQDNCKRKKNTIESILSQLIAEPGLLDTPCLVWPKSAGKRRYGQVGLDGKSCYVHRLAWEHYVGPIPDGLTIDHLCFNKSCANTSHMEVVTQSENSRRGSRRRYSPPRLTTHCHRGHPYSEKNTYITPDGGRQCRTCNRENYHLRKHRRKILP
jgi:hypothetical protein